jgi:hypothetical protein
VTAPAAVAELGTLSSARPLPPPAQAAPSEIDEAAAHFAVLAFANAHGRLPDPMKSDADLRTCELLVETLSECGRVLFELRRDMAEIQNALAYLARRR